MVDNVVVVRVLIIHFVSRFRIHLLYNYGCCAYEVMLSICIWMTLHNINLLM